MPIDDFFHFLWMDFQSAYVNYTVPPADEAVTISS
jgi:hypothetical protein